MKQLDFLDWFIWFRSYQLNLRHHKSNTQPGKLLKQFRALENKVSAWYKHSKTEITEEIISNIFDGYYPAS